MLCELVTKGFVISVVISSRSPHIKKYKMAGLAVFEHDFAGESRRQSLKLLTRVMKQTSPDLIHCFSKRALQVAVLFKLSPLTAGSKIPLLGYRGIIGNLSVFDPLSWLSFLNPRVSKVVCVCRAVQDYMESFSCLSGKVETIHKGHEIEWYEVNPPELEVDLPKGAFLISCLCNMRPRKGLQYLLEALAELPERAHLLLIGDLGGDEDKLEAACRKLGIEGRVHSIGFRERGWRYLRHSRVFVMPSVRREGFPKAVMEAMAQAVPPVVTAVGGMVEQVENGRTGFVVGPGDSGALAGALIQYVENEELVRQHGEAAQASVQAKFAFSRTCANYAELYDSLA